MSSVDGLPAWRGGLADLMPAVAAGFGVPGARDVLGLPRADRVVVVLVDGLGARLVDAHAELAPTMAAMAARAHGALRTTFPSTTATALGSFGTGLPPGGHGLMGTAFLLPETDAVLQPLGWRDEPHPLAVQPEPTVLERLEASGVAVSTVSAAAYATSGLTRAVLRGGRYLGADDDAARLAALREALAPDRAVVYLYIGELDRTGHIHGVDSEEWRGVLGAVDALMAAVVDIAPAGTAVHVTADHGMLDVPDAARVDLDGRPDLAAGVHVLAGEPRARHVYAEPGRAAAVLGRWRDELGDAALVVGRDEAEASGWFGEVDPELAARIGDVVAVPRDGRTLVSARTDSLVSSLRGQHGGLDDVEVAIPLLTAVAG